MYTRLFNLFYVFFVRKKTQDPIFDSSCLIFIAQVIHFCFLLLLLSKILNFEILFFSKNNSNNKLAILPFASIWLYFTYKYFKNRINISISKYEDKSNSYFMIIIFIVIFIPLYLVIKLSGGSLWKF